MKKQSKKFMLAGVLLLAIAGLLALTSCKNDSVPEPPSEADWLQEQKKELEGKTEGTYTITAPSYLTKGGLVDLAKLLRERASRPIGAVSVDLDLSQATGLTYIAAGTFIGCGTLQSVKLPSSVTEIGEYAFAYTALPEVTIPEGVTTIGASAFAYTNLTEVTIPEGVTFIGDSAFKNCTSLTEVTIPEGVTTIGFYAFYNCQSLTEVTIPEGVTTIGDSAFASTDLREVTIPTSVTKIGKYAFEYCSSLTQVIFEETKGWYTKTDLYNEDELPVSIDVSTPSTNAGKLLGGEWLNMNLIRE